MIRELVPGIRPSTIKKLCLLISECYRISKKQNHSGSGCFEVSHQRSELILSRFDGKRPLTVLRMIGLIEEVAPHRASIRPKANTYRFCLQRFKPYMIAMTGKAAEKACQSAVRTNLRRSRNPEYSWVKRSLKRVSLPDKAQQEYCAMSNHKRNAESFAAGRRSLSWKRDHFGHVVCNMPEEFREQLLFDGEVPVALLDISASFPSMLPWLLKDDTGHLRRIEKIDDEEMESRLRECKRLSAFLSRDDFYSEILPGHPRNKVKSAFQRALNSTDCDPFAARVFRAFREHFPNTYNLIYRRRKLKTATKRQRKPKRKKKPTPPIFFELRGRQSEIIKAVILKCRQAGIPCLPVADELIVPFVQRLTVQRWMWEEIRERTGVRAKVGGQRQPPTESETPCPDDLCERCWENNVAIPLSSPFGCRHNPKPDSCDPDIRAAEPF